MEPTNRRHPIPWCYLVLIVIPLTEFWYFDKVLELIARFCATLCELAVCSRIWKAVLKVEQYDYYVRKYH